MIAEKRMLHRIAWIVLAILLPVLFLAAIFSRHTQPVNQDIPVVEREASNINE